MSLVLRYLMIALAITFFVLGMQLPNLADQYGQRVDAHLREVEHNLQPFQEIANRFTHGSIDALIALHRRSDQPAFRAEGDAIERMVLRRRQFEAELAALKVSWPLKLYHILVHGDRALREETVLQYSANVPINTDALVAGGLAALLGLLLIEGVLALTRRAELGVTRWFNHRWRPE